MRAVRIALVGLVVLAGLLVAGDRVAVRMAESEVAGQVRDGLDLETEPDVSVHGFPFLTQLLGRELQRVDLSLPGYTVQLDDDLLSVDDLDIELHDVTLEDGYRDAVAARASGEGMISYEEMTSITDPEDSRVGMTMEYAGDGQVELRATLMDQPVGPTMLGDVVAEGTTVTLVVEEIPSFSDVPLLGDIDRIDEEIRKRLDREREITGLPSGVELADLEATEDGIALSVTGSDVRLTNDTTTEDTTTEDADTEDSES